MCTPRDTGAPALTLGQVYHYAYDALGDPAKAAIAAAIAVPESGLKPGILNDCPATGDLSYGLWQINMIGGNGPARRAQLGISSNEALFDPAVNARAMALLSGGGDHWTDWCAYNNGRNNLCKTQSAPQLVTQESIGAAYVAGTGALGDPLPDFIAGPAGAVGAVLSPFTSVVDFLNWLRERVAWLLDRHNAFRVLQFVGGAVAVLMGAVVLVKGLAPIQAVPNLSLIQGGAAA